MANWIKPSELPEEFWEEAWVTFKMWEDSKPSAPEIRSIRRASFSRCELYMDTQKYWEVIPDSDYRVKIIPRETSEGAFK